jgi:hypothetical protein
MIPNRRKNLVKTEPGKKASFIDTLRIKRLSVRISPILITGIEPLK